ncbi:MAG: helix-hairpin-helix domain-containing protein [Mucinivorans sp.]
MKSKSYFLLLFFVVLLLAVAFGLRLTTVGGYGVVCRRADSLRQAHDKVLWGQDSVGFFKGDSFKKGKVIRYRVRHIELNGADSAALVSVYGIGATFAHRILAYRSALGGYCSVEQLREVRGIDEQVWQRIYQNFWVDSSGIQKIDVNFAPLTLLRAHPYIGGNAAKRIIKGIKSKGGYCTLKQLIDQDILLPAEAKRLAPYLSFRQKTTN